MKRSENRVLTTHTGSLHRPPDVLQQLIAKEAGKDVDPEAFECLVRRSIREVVQRQVAAGVDVINDGEIGRASYATYVKDRLNGLDGPENPLPLFGLTRDAEAFPGWQERWSEKQKHVVQRPSCNAPVEPGDGSAVRHDIEVLKEAAQGLPYTELFMTAISPASVAHNHPNMYYKSQEDYMFAIAEALRPEYAAIVDAGLILQIDCADLGGRRPEGMSLEEVRADRAMKVDLINHATKHLPADRIRVHVCWGALERPHNDDAELASFVDILLTAHPEGLMVTAANPRHAHEWKVWRDIEVPAGKVIIPGVIDSTTNIIEHPRAVADRIVNYAGVLGRENVIAGVDCGFSSNINIDDVDSEIAWAKLKALVDGAALASSDLWK